MRLRTPSAASSSSRAISTKCGGSCENFRASTLRVFGLISRAGRRSSSRSMTLGERDASTRFSTSRRSCSARFFSVFSVGEPIAAPPFDRNRLPLRHWKRSRHGSVIQGRIGSLPGFLLGESYERAFASTSRPAIDDDPQLVELPEPLLSVLNVKARQLRDLLRVRRVGQLRPQRGHRHDRSEHAVVLERQSRSALARPMLGGALERLTRGRATLHVVVARARRRRHAALFATRRAGAAAADSAGSAPSASAGAGTCPAASGDAARRSARILRAARSRIA